jgi:CheY-like chemotaxis protein
MDARPRILGVDDSLTIRKALEIVLKPAGYELELAADGAEALAKAKALHPALILLDFILPDLRGTEVCRQLAADPETAHIPVVLISAKGAELEQAYRDVSNVVSYIAKPFKPPVLTGVVAEVLARAAAGELVKLRLPTDATPPTTIPTPVFPPPTVAGEQAVASLSEDAAVPETGGDAPVPEDFDDSENDAVLALPFDDAEARAARRERIEWMFETLRSGLEGVYVEEVDTPAGATADQAKSYTDLIEQLSYQLEEGLHQARSGARYRLYGDGSIRSFDEALLDVFRRSCRLLFRAAAAGTHTPEASPHSDRVVVACTRHSPKCEQLQSALATHPDWSVVVVGENFRQLPLLVRLFGPSVILAEITWSGALWDQLRVIRQMPEAQTIRTIGIADPASLACLNDADRQTRMALLAERGVSSVLQSTSELEGVLTNEHSMRDNARATGELRMAV